MHAAAQQVHGTTVLPAVAGQRLVRPIALACGLFEPVHPPPARMPAPKPREFFIQGITLAGRTFRPSDWSERLAGTLSSFKPKSGAFGGAAAGGIGAHIGYSPYCVPRVIDGVKCVIVSEALRDLEPMAWDFAMHFARDNELRVVEACLAPGPAIKPVN